jgi:hypothetical protein
VSYSSINPNKMHTLQSLFYLTTALHVSGVTITHLQEHKTTVTTASGNRYTVLFVCCYRGRVGTDLSVLWVAYVVVGVRHPQHTQILANSSMIAADKQYGVTVTRCRSYSCFVLLKKGDSDARNM